MNTFYINEAKIPAGKVQLNGQLIIPEGAKAIILFAHASGSSRFSNRNRMLASYLQERHFGTLLFDLLTMEEDMEFINRYNINLLTDRLVFATNWLQTLTAADNLGFGYFGNGTGSAAALKAARRLPQIGAVVSRGGRPDLALDILPSIHAPVLLMVGSKDQDLLKLNQEVLDQLPGKKRLEIIPGATHLFEETDAMERLCELSTDWFEKFLCPETVLH